ncbi:nuclear transport factor 2 family protein [Streptomyces mirabilis]|nr:nuclear transport factor 2 family protein [Streptomyces mirabilis]
MQSGPEALEISTLLDRYLIGLDDDELDDAWARGLFTKDALVEFPMSRHEGLDGLAGYHREALAAFAATQHLGSPAVVDLDDAGEQAVLRANLVSTHVHHPDAADEPLFQVGTSRPARPAAPRRAGGSPPDLPRAVDPRHPAPTREPQ